LIDSGLGIAYTGTSRPAAGTEHMIGQTWEIMDLENHRPNHLHGIEVGEATFTAISMFRRLYTESPDSKIKALIERFLPFFENVCDLQRTLHLPFAVTDKRIFTEGVLRGRTFRERYTLLQYLYDRGQLEDYAESAYTETMDMQ
jgi:glycerol dehydrogenase-like iron-containing ADH family enzyme